MSKATPILTCVVGSKLHGLVNENSDTDYAHVVMSSLRSIISPFQKDETYQSVSEEDHVTYELRKLCFLAAQGNPTILEVLWSPLRFTQAPNIAYILDDQRTKFLDSKRVHDAHLGYAKSQLGRMTSASDIKRVGKAAAAYIRVLLQGIDLIKTGDFSTTVVRHVDLLHVLKRGANMGFVEEFARPVFDELERELHDALDNATVRYHPDVEWIEDFLVSAYSGRYS